MAAAWLLLVVAGTSLCNVPASAFTTPELQDRRALREVGCRPRGFLDPVLRWRRGVSAGGTLSDPAPIRRTAPDPSFRASGRGDSAARRPYLNETQNLSPLEPPEGCYIGVGLGAGDTIERLSFRLGLRPAVYCNFFRFPLTDQARADLGRFLDEVRPTGGVALVTLEPYTGLSNVTEDAAIDFARLCRQQENSGMGGILVRFAHEMNGNWNPWGQQPVLYKDRFRLLAGHVHAETTRTAMLWAPSYGGGYPYGTNQVASGTADFAALDTDGDGVLTQYDDPYEPYYPGDDAVDWVGLTLYHWGVEWPWLENELPETNSFTRLLTGEYNGGNGDQTAVPDFYGRYCADPARHKPLAIPETAAFFNPHQGGESELAVKSAWFRQLFNISGDTPDALDVAQHFPKLKCVCWFDHYKLEPEQQQWIDWRLSAYEPVRSAFAGHMRTLRDGRPWFLTAQAFQCLGRSDAITELELPTLLPVTGHVALAFYVRAVTDEDLLVELADDQGRRRGGASARVPGGSGIVRLDLALDDGPLVDGATYRWRICLVPAGSDATRAVARYDGLPAVARSITPSIQCLAFPPVLVSTSAFTVKIRYTAAQPAVAVVNLLDAEYHWRGGARFDARRGEGLVEVPLALEPGLTNGSYRLEAYLSDSPMNWQNAYARSGSFPLTVVHEPQGESVNVVAESAVIPAGEVFRFVLEYVAMTNRDLHIDLFDANTNFLAGALQPVPAGSGIGDLTLSHPVSPPGDYFVTAFMTPVGRSWQDAVAWSADRRMTLVSREYRAWIEPFWGVVLAEDPVHPDDDPDGDGVSNGEEFLAGTDPRQAEPGPKLRISGTGGRLTLRWLSVSGRRYQVWQCRALSGDGWSTLGAPLDGTGTILEVSLAPGNGAEFFRVEAIP